MILDDRAQFSDAQENTTSVASTDVIDTVAAGDSYEGAWFVALVDTAFTANSATPTNTFQLQTSDTEAFLGGSNAQTLVQSAAYIYTDLTAGKFFAARIPPGAKRYLRGYKLTAGETAGSAVYSAGKFDMFITKDIDLEINKRRLLRRA
jgi:hypothetical protein